MASAFSEEDLSCPVCYEIFKDPVILTCSHSFCKGCLSTFWETKTSRECPVCRAKSSQNDPPRNLHLKNLCEAFMTEQRKPPADRKWTEDQEKPICTLHQSELKLYCEDDKQLVCLVCRDSKLHKKHNFSPIDEAALECKEELRIKLKPLQQKLAKLKDVKTTYSVEDIKIQAQHTERQMKQNFEKLHQFLQDEEAARISALRKEEEQKSQMMEEKIEKMNREITSLSDTIRTIEENIRSDDVMLLQSYKKTMARVQFSLPDSEQGPQTINVRNYLGNMEEVWENIKNMWFSNVSGALWKALTLDPNTAHPQLHISPDMTIFRYSRRNLPYNPERFDRWVNVLGSEGFASGVHCWGVEVGDCSNWDVGVVTESAKRKGMITNWPGVWYLHYGRGSYEVVESLQPSCSLAVRQKPRKIRVLLDWERGKVSFYDADYNTHLHTFRHAFSERVFPFFGSQCPEVPVKIVPLE